MSAANPILTTPVPTPGLLLPRSNRGQPDRITNAITQKYAQALVTDIGLPGMPASQLIEQPAAAGGPAAYSITGAVTLSLTPSATMLEGRGILGAVTLTLTPAAQMLEGRVRAGAVPLTVTPAAQMLEGRGLVGHVTVSFTPAAAMQYVAAVLGGGSVRLNWQWARARMRVQRTYAIVGDVTLTLSPAAVMEFTDERDAPLDDLLFALLLEDDVYA